MDQSPRGYHSSRGIARTQSNKKSVFPHMNTNSKYKNALHPEISTDDSQNIVLHLSDSANTEYSSYQYYKEQAQRKLRVSKVIVISDSSESSSPEKIERKFQYNQYADNRGDSVLIEESSSSDESNSDNERIQFSDGNNKNVNENAFKSQRKIIGSSDETICTINSDKSSDDSHVSATPKERNFDGLIFSKLPETRSRFFVDEPVSNVTMRKYPNHKTIRPKRPFYFTDMKKATESTDSRADTRGSGSSEETSFKETKPDDEQTDEVIEESDVTHITATPPKEENREEPPAVTLSERKKKEIATWLMTNSPQSRTNSTCSSVSDSKKDLSSGNSSLDRFEMNYETPNNRDRIKKMQGTKTTDNHKSKGQHATIDRYLRKIAPSEYETPQNKISNFNTLITKGSYKTCSENLDILDCADVLDNLYGSDWRKNADVILQSSEPRKQHVSRIDRAVQTEKKKLPKSKFQTISISDSESDEENCNVFIKNSKPQKEITTKKKSKKYINSFIDDRNLSEISGDSIYHTAITQRISSDSPANKVNNIDNKVQRVLSEICDPDTDEEEEKKVTKSRVFNKRRLLFTDDDTNGSSTSEFDPEDQVLPKPMPKKDFSKVPYHTPKVTTKTKTSPFEPRAVKSFLASLSSNISMTEAHPDAKIYRTNFKNKKEELCRKLFHLYNENIFESKLPKDMPIEWSARMTETAGFCFNKRTIRSSGGIIRSSRIQLATKIIDTPDRLRDTLVHEMCHAAAWIINDVSDGHGPYWKSWVNKAMKAFPELPEIKRCHDYKINTKYTYRCTGCGYSIGRHSKSLDIEKKRCGHCYGKFEVLINKTMKSGTVQMKTPVRSKEPSGFALYVKENYHSIKQNRRSMKHGEVMKILGQQFSAIKIAKKHDNVEQNNAGSED